MSNRVFIPCLLLTVAALLAAAPAAAGVAEAAAPAATPASPGIEMARQLTLITGIAISPLLGVSGLGAWDYFRAPASARPTLPWYADPWFFGPALALVLILNLKEVFLGLFPPAKKLLDACEVVENKLSATVIAAPMLIAATIGMMQEMTAGGSHAAPAALAGGPVSASLVPEVSLLLTILALVLCLAAFTVVWLAGQAINLLILISPFAFIDFLLKSFKYAVLGLLLVAALIHPYLGALVSLLILFAAVRTAGWTWRLAVFGSLFLGDLALRRHRRIDPATAPVRAFVERKLGRIPTRACGTLAPVAGGRLEFQEAGRLSLHRRRQELTVGGIVIARGLFGPRILETDAQGRPAAVLFCLPPRFRGHEEILAGRLNVGWDRSGALTGRLGGAWAWLSGMIRGRRSGGDPAAAATN